MRAIKIFVSMTDAPGARRLAAAIGLTLLNGCASAPPTTAEPLCQAIATFASEAPLSPALQVQLVGGRRINPPAPEHYCRHGGSKPGEKLCGYLVPNTTWEFGSAFAEKAFQCLERRTFRQAQSALHSNAPRVEAIARLNGADSKTRPVRIVFEATTSTGLYTLAIGTE